jgi:hypothetical protein
LWIHNRWEVPQADDKTVEHEKVCIKKETKGTIHWAAITDISHCTSVMATGKIVCSIFFAGDELLRME